MKRIWQYLALRINTCSQTAKNINIPTTERKLAWPREMATRLKCAGANSHELLNTEKRMGA